MHSDRPTSKFRRILIPLFVPLGWLSLLIILWQLGVDVSGGESPLYPSPIRVVDALWASIINGLLVTDLAWSLLRVVIGFSIGSSLGLACGVVTSSVAVIDRTIGLLIEIIRPIPPVALVPLFVLWFGLGEFPKDALIVAGVLPTVWISTHIGLRSVDQHYVWTAQSLGATRTRLISRVMLPAALPIILAGLRTAMGIAFYCLVAAEMAGALYGISYRIELSNQYFRVDQMIAYLAVLGVTFLLSQYAFKVITRVAFPWIPSNGNKYGD